MTDSVVNKQLANVIRLTVTQTHHVRRSLVSMVMACVTGASSSDSMNDRLRHDPEVGIMANVKTIVARCSGFVLLLGVALSDESRMHGKQHISTNDGLLRTEREEYSDD